MRRQIAGAGLLSLALQAGTAGAKEVGIRTPGGRTVYDTNEAFSQVFDTRKRRFVVETVAGVTPEGNIGMLIGWINQPVRGFEYYAGFGYEVNPALALTLSARYVFNISGFRPYVSLGYAYKDLTGIGTFNHNVFGEIGYSWVLHQTYHLSAGVGARRIVYIGIKEDSPLAAPDVDPAFLASETDNVSRWAPLISLRFSRAF
jgi:hypothetical protein